MLLRINIKFKQQNKSVGWIDSIGRFKTVIIRK